MTITSKVYNEQERQAWKALQDIPNIGPACAHDLMLLGIRSASDLKGKDPDALYHSLCASTGVRHDPCVWDTLASAVHFAETGERKVWWEFTTIRKKRGLQL